MIIRLIIFSALLLISVYGQLHAGPPSPAPITECSDGYGINEAANRCDICVAGTYSSENSCLLCPPNTFSRANGTTSCSFCKGETNSYQGATTCSKCPFNTYFESNGTGSCNSCSYPYGSSTVRGNYLKCSVFSLQFDGVIAAIPLFATYLASVPFIPVTDRGDYVVFNTVYIGFRSLYIGYLASNSFLLPIFLVSALVLLLVPLILYCHLVYRKEYKCRWIWVSPKYMLPADLLPSCLHTVIKYTLLAPIACAVNGVMVICLFLVGFLLYVTKAIHHKAFLSPWLSWWMLNLSYPAEHDVEEYASCTLRECMSEFIALTLLFLVNTYHFSQLSRIATMLAIAISLIAFVGMIAFYDRVFPTKVTPINKLDYEDDDAFNVLEGGHHRQNYSEMDQSNNCDSPPYQQQHDSDGQQESHFMSNGIELR